VRLIGKSLTLTFTGSVESFFDRRIVKTSQLV
jgi:hypothetical protein